MSLALFSILLQNLYTNYLSWNVLSIRSSSFTSVITPKKDMVGWC